MPRIAFVCENKSGLSSIVSDRFGRAPYIVIVDIDENNDIRNIKEIENPGSTARGGAAIKVVQKLVNEDVNAVVAGAFGPNAMAALEEIKIKYFQISGISVKEALGKILSSHH